MKNNTDVSFEEFAASKKEMDRRKNAFLTPRYGKIISVIEYIEGVEAQARPVNPVISESIA